MEWFIAVYAFIKVVRFQITFTARTGTHIETTENDVNKQHKYTDTA